MVVDHCINPKYQIKMVYFLSYYKKIFSIYHIARKFGLRNILNIYGWAIVSITIS